MGRSGVISNINQALPTNGNDEISAQDLRGVLIADVVNGFMNLEDDAEIPIYSSLKSYKSGKLVLNQDVIWQALVNVNPTQAPPTLPTTSNTYWKVQGSILLNEATQPEIELETSTEAGKFVSPRRFWQGIDRFKALVGTFLEKITFFKGIALGNNATPSANGDFWFDGTSFRGRQANVNNRFPTSLNGKTGRVFYVSAVDGDDSTAIIGSKLFMYRSIQTALNSATVAGDSVTVYNGSYAENLQVTPRSFPSGITITLEDGVTITGTINFVGNGAYVNIKARNFGSARIIGNFGISSGSYAILNLQNILWNGNITGDVRVGSWVNNWITSTAQYTLTRGGNANLEDNGYLPEFVGNTLYTNVGVTIQAPVVKGNTFVGLNNSGYILNVLTLNSTISNFGQTFEGNKVVNRGTGIAVQMDYNAMFNITDCSFKTQGILACMVIQGNGNTTGRLISCKFQATTTAIDNNGYGGGGTLTVSNKNCISNVPMLAVKPQLVDAPFNQNIDSNFVI
jgi:hypothetical protein